ncbi:two component transcriptional regulator, LuxR family [Bifidobacterium goeldii]|uniref:Two component transcriptional regulator, LuxR family n=1 Tax=Bifidobacterium goeldii TaxID=2306975 RepID=A0A430FKX1_9BIFI|nr:LuxR C-terminal-related transcriptional regulator [Bifidobacterium goeldii]RSX53544.1 two component transcriptional regulator, LuxR family [Bifidobacterium goeldii]
MSEPGIGANDSTVVMTAAVDNDRMALLALKGILPQLLPSSRWMWGAQTADEAIRKTLNPETRPRLLLVDMSLGESTGIGVCRSIRQRDDRVMLLAITAFPIDSYAARAADAGAQGIASKADIPQLAAALRALAAGGTFSPVPGVTFRDIAHAHAAVTGEQDDAPQLPKLGAKEAQTLHLLSRGLTYEQIATQWGVSTSTVRTHAHRAVEKLNAHSLAHAIAIWLSR